MKTETNKDTDRYDVVIFDFATRTIESVIGKNLVYERNGYGESACKRLSTAFMRINEHYDAAIVLTGKFKEGDVLAIEDEID